jgi:hypothetical protein
MAELQRYNPTGLGLASLPGLPTVEPIALQEQIRSSQGLQSSLDRISQFAFREAEEEAKRKGQLFGIQNPPTKDQIDAILASGSLAEQTKKVGEILQPAGTAFGDAARQAQSSMLRVEFETETRKLLTNISAAIDAGQVNNLDQVVSAVNAQVDTFTKILGNVSPNDALHYKSTASVAGNAVYNKAASHIIKMRTEAIKQSVDESLVNSSTILSDSFANGPTEDAVAGAVFVERERVRSAALKVGDPAFYKSTMEAFDKRLVRGIADRLMHPDMNMSPGQALEAIDKGELNVLSQAAKLVDKQALKSAYIERLSTEVTVKAQADKLVQERTKDDALEVWDKLETGLISPDKAIVQLRAMGRLSVPELQSIRNGDFGDKKASAKVYGIYESRADRGQISEDELTEAANNGTISYSQRNSLAKIVRNNDTKIGQAKQYIDLSLGINDPLSPDIPDAVRQRSAITKARLIETADAARKTGEPFDPMATARVLVSEKQDAIKEKIVADAKKRIVDLMKQDGLAYDEKTVYTDESLNRAGIKDAAKRKAILRQQKTIRGE